MTKALEAGLDAVANLAPQDNERSIAGLKDAIDKFGMTAIEIKAERDRLKILNEELLDALITSLSFIEDCEGEEMYKPGAVKKVIKHIRAVIEIASGAA